MYTRDRAQILEAVERRQIRFSRFGPRFTDFLWFSWTDHVNLRASSDSANEV